MIKAGCYVCLRYAQTTVGDLGFAARSVGISLGPGLVASQRAEPKRRSSRPRRKAINDRSFGKAVERKAESGRIRFYDEPVADRRQVRGSA